MREEAMAEIDAALSGESQETSPAPSSGAQVTPNEDTSPIISDEMPHRTLWPALRGYLGSLPMPTSILLPLVLLLVAFFLLIPVNGHTRFVWFWLSLTGNASIGQGSGGGEIAPLAPALAQTSLFPTSPVQEII